MILLFFIGQVLSQNQLIQLTDYFQNTWILYDDQGLNPLFNWENKQCCTPPKLQVIVANESSNYTNNITANFSGLECQYAEEKKKPRGTKIKIARYENNGSLWIFNECKLNKQAYKKSINENGIAHITFGFVNQSTQAKSTLEFQYYISCVYSDDNTQKINYDSTMIIIALFWLLFLALFSIPLKFKAFNFKIPNPANSRNCLNCFAHQPFLNKYEYIYFSGFNLTWIPITCYFIIITIFNLIIILKPENNLGAFFITTLILAFLLCWVFFIECFVRFRNFMNIKTKQDFKYYRLFDYFISMILSATLCYLYSKHQFWFLSSVIAVCCAWTLSQAIKATSLKQIFIFYTLIIIYDIVFQIVYMSKPGNNYQIDVLMYTNNPFIFQIPLMKAYMNKVCSWISVSDLVIATLSFSYYARFVKNYKFSTMDNMWCSIILGLFAWIIIAIINCVYGKQIAQAFIFLPVIIGLVYFCEIKIEFDILWSGNFYDKYVGRVVQPDEQKEENEERIKNEISLAENISNQQFESLLELYGNNNEL